MTPNSLKRFWSKVNKGSPDECWLWNACTVGWGYGQLRLDDKRSMAHRLSWEIHNGKIPKRKWVLHHCDVPHCVNPSHLFLGTHVDNMADMKDKGRTGFVSGEDAQFSKLTEIEVRTIRLYSEIMSNIELSDTFKVHRSTIWKIVTRRIWKHI